MSRAPMTFMPCVYKCYCTGEAQQEVCEQNVSDLHFAVGSNTIPNADTDACASIIDYIILTMIKGLRAETPLPRRRDSGARCSSPSHAGGASAGPSC